MPHPPLVVVVVALSAALHGLPRSSSRQQALFFVVFHVLHRTADLRRRRRLLLLGFCFLSEHWTNAASCFRTNYHNNSFSSSLTNSPPNHTEKQQQKETPTQAGGKPQPDTFWSLNLKRCLRGGSFVSSSITENAPGFFFFFFHFDENLFIHRTWLLFSHSEEYTLSSRWKTHVSVTFNIFIYFCLYCSFSFWSLIHSEINFLLRGKTTQYTFIALLHTLLRCRIQNGN